VTFGSAAKAQGCNPAPDELKHAWIAANGYVEIVPRILEATLLQSHKSTQAEICRVVTKLDEFVAGCPRDIQFANRNNANQTLKVTCV
jgi:hypothetical protein